MKKTSTDFNNFAKDLTESHGEGVRFLLEQVTAGLRSFQPSLHDGLSPAKQTRTHTGSIALFQTVNYITSTPDSNSDYICV